MRRSPRDYQKGHLNKSLADQMVHWSEPYITRLLDGRVRVLPRTEIFCGLEEKFFPASRITVPQSAIFYGLG